MLQDQKNVSSLIIPNLDEVMQMIEKNILKMITKNLDLSKEYFDTLSALRRLEKIADRAVSIANLLQFAQVGGDIVQS